jgi:hypothetical protein
VSSSPADSTGRAPSRVISDCAMFERSTIVTVIAMNATPVLTAE